MTASDLAAAYFDAWAAGEPERVRPLLADDVSFRGPLAALDGVDACVQGLTGLFGMTERVEVVHRWVDGDDAITWFELTTAKTKPIPVVNWSHARDGRIDRIRVAFDPRPLLA